MGFLANVKVYILLTAELSSRKESQNVLVLPIFRNLSKGLQLCCRFWKPDMSLQACAVNPTKWCPFKWREGYTDIICTLFLIPSSLKWWKWGKRILVAKKRVTHSVPQAPHDDGKVSTCPREICKVRINIIHNEIVARAWQTYLFWCWVSTQCCSNFVRASLSYSATTCNSSKRAMGHTLQPVRIGFHCWSRQNSLSRMFYCWFSKKTKCCLLLTSPFIESHR